MERKTDSVDLTCSGRTLELHSMDQSFPSLPLGSQLRKGSNDESYDRRHRFVRFDATSLTNRFIESYDFFGTPPMDECESEGDHRSHSSAPPQ
ncbi:hypothetical protein [Porphyromonas cangingivalis]|uniref:hypothetical protein n=1 Tax=Porphyromonas cangingivalis TaxID=36874 RepID=UPI00126A7696|nr:hypothetical protein [Porphyromonas cangingivalis]